MTSPTPPRLPIPGGRQLTIKLSTAGQTAAVVLGAQGAGGWSDANATRVWLNAFWSRFRFVCLTNVTCLGAIGRDVSGPDAPVYEVGAPTDQNGAYAGGQSVLAASTLIKWNTATGGRTGKGRTYIPGFSTAFLTADGRGYTAAYGATVQSHIDGYLADAALAAEGLDPAVLSFTRGAARPITSGSLASVVGIQRRRMR